MEWYFFAITTAVLVSIYTLVEKKALMKEHAMEFSAVLAIFNFLISLVLVPFIKIDFPIKLLGLIYLASLMGAVGFLHIAKAIRHMDVSLVAPLTTFSPAFVVVLAYFILGEIVTIIQIGGITLLIMGSFLLESKNHGTIKIFTRTFKSNYFYYMFFALTLYGFCAIIDKAILKTVSPVTYLPIINFFLAFNFIVFIIVFHNGFQGIKNGIKSNGKWIFLVAVLISLSRLSQYQAFSMAYVSLVIPIKRMSAFFATLIGGKVFHEKNLAKRVFACVIMLCGAFLVILG